MLCSDRKVKGEVYCKNSEVSGNVDGKICVSQLLTLKADSKNQRYCDLQAVDRAWCKVHGTKMSDTENNEGANFGKQQREQKKSLKNQGSKALQDFGKYQDWPFR